MKEAKKYQNSSVRVEIHDDDGRHVSFLDEMCVWPLMGQPASIPSFFGKGG